MTVKKGFAWHMSGLAVLVALFSMTKQGWAQCGSEGDPIINITFGTQANPNFGDGTTTYRHVPLGQQAQGEGWYRLVSNINEGLGSWHNLRDHTGDPGGLMFVVNADDDPGEFYRVRVSGLCENTRFRFGAWIANANRLEECGGTPIPPNVRFIIQDLNGNVVNDPYATGNIMPTASPVWQEYGFEFDTGNQTEFDLVLINDNPGGCGNDLAIDDIQFRPCGPLLALEMDLTLKQADTLFFCEDAAGPVVIGSRVSSGGAYPAIPAFQWQTRQTGDPVWHDIDGERGETLTIIPVHNRWYRLTAAATSTNLNNPLCRIASDAIRIAQVAPPAVVPELQVPDALCVQESVSFAPPAYRGENVGPVTYRWQNDEGNGFVDIADADASGYAFHAGDQARSVVLRRQVINRCGERFVTHVYQVEVREIVRAAFTFPGLTTCADDEPIQLSGGRFLNDDGGLVGIYSGNGVSNGVFDPRSAGVGQHVITYSAPPDVRCAEPAQVVMTVFDSISIEPMRSIVMLAGQRVTLRPETNATQFDWDNQPGLSDYHVPDPVASPTGTTTYTLTASNVNGCSKQETVTVIVLRNLVVPNGFTPNGDGINDEWEIDGLEEYPNVFIQVFNRWGALVFSSRGYPVPWNGQFNGHYLPAATYYYTIASDVLSQPVSGSVSILR